MKKSLVKKKLGLIAVVMTLSLLFLVQFALAAIVINEFTVDPQTDWNGKGGITSSDEFYELYNSGDSDVDVTGWNLSLFKNSTKFSSELLSGIINSKGFMVILNSNGNQNGRLVLYDLSMNVVDSVSYGNFDDGNIADNSPDGNADDIEDECLARLTDGKDTSNDADDWVKKKCSFNATNNNILIENKIASACAIENKNVTLLADVAGDITKIWFSYTINGVNYNKTGTKVGGTARTYSAIIPVSELTNGNIQWNVYVNDSNGNTYSNGEQNLFVRSETESMTEPVIPDGENGWYVSVPEITLMNNDAQKIFYRWNAGALQEISGTQVQFIPPTNSSGLLKLTWWSQFNCGTESTQMQNFKLDLNNPAIIEIMPEENAVLEENKVMIQALLDDIYQGNAGVNKTSVIMKIDGTPINPQISNADGLDALVKYTVENLSDGEHTVEISVKDNAGRMSVKNWMFSVNSSLALVDMQVHSPTDGLYNTKRIPINISLSNEVEELVYMDYAEERPRMKTLCRDCSDFGFDRKRLKSFKDGFHNITFIALKKGKIVANKTVAFTIDSEAPKITQTEPRSGFTNGLFHYAFEETNVDLIQLLIDGAAIQLNFSDCTLDRKEYQCNSLVPLSHFENQEIHYRLRVSDMVNNSDESRENTVTVDTSNPIITALNFSIDKQKVNFMIAINESHFEEATFIDLDNPGREFRLCSRLEDGVCAARKTFSKGDHRIQINVYDKAGNMIAQEISFSI